MTNSGQLARAQSLPLSHIYVVLYLLTHIYIKVYIMKNICFCGSYLNVGTEKFDIQLRFQWQTIPRMYGVFLLPSKNSLLVSILLAQVVDERRRKI